MDPVTLYAKATIDKPYILLGTLKKGAYHEASYYGVRTFIRFTDIGQKLWEAMNILDEQVNIRIVDHSWLEEDKNWEVEIDGSSFNIVLKSMRYRNVGKFPSAFYISIQIHGDPKLMTRFIERFYKSLGREPWKGMNWNNLLKTNSLTKEKVINGWMEFLKDKKIIPSLIFFGQPTTDKPYLPISSLKKGDFQVCSKLSLQSYICFSGIGLSVWETARNLDKDATIGLKEISNLEEDREWEVLIETNLLNVAIQSTRYKKLGNNISAFYISLDFSGTYEHIYDFVVKMVTNLDRGIFEISDWHRFTLKTCVTKEEVIKRWLEFSDVNIKIKDKLLMMNIDNDSNLYNELAISLAEIDRTKIELEKAKGYLDNVISSMVDTLVVVDLNGKITSVNRATSDLLGYKEKDLIGQHIEMIMVPSSIDAPKEGTRNEVKSFSDLIYGEVIKDVEVTYQAKDGRKIPVSFSGSPRRDSKEGLIGYVCVGKDLSELKKAYEELKVLDKMKSDFIDIASHELKTPLTPIKGYLELLTDGYLGELNEKQNEIMERLIKNIDHLSTIITITNCS